MGGHAQPAAWTLRLHACWVKFRGGWAMDAPCLVPNPPGLQPLCKVTKGRPIPVHITGAVLVRTSFPFSGVLVGPMSLVCSFSGVTH